MFFMCKKFLLGAILTMAVCLTACAKGGMETAETSAETAAETTTAIETAVPESEGTDETVPEITDPIAAAEKYLQELSESENVKAVELHETRIGQNYFAADKYYESPLAEKFGVTEDTLLVPVNVDYYIEYTENSGLESGEKSDYFIVDQNQNGFCVIDTFPYEPKDYYGEVKEILKDSNGDIDFYMVELDGGLGTVKCNNAAMMSITFEAGTRIYIEANGDIYGETPRLDALHMCEESEMFHAD